MDWPLSRLRKGAAAAASPKSRPELVRAPKLGQNAAKFGKVARNEAVWGQNRGKWRWKSLRNRGLGTEGAKVMLKGPKFAGNGPKVPQESGVGPEGAQK